MAKKEIVYVNGRPTIKTEKVKVEYEYAELETMFSHCRDINDILLTAISNGIPFTFKSPGCPTKGKGGVQELWRIRLYAEKTLVKEAYTGKGLCHQLAVEDVRIPPVTIYDALNKDYRDAEKLSLEAMVETASKEAQEAREAVKEELRAAEDAAEEEFHSGLTI